jgi:hypothetical protein
MIRWDGSVSKVTEQGTDDRGSIPDRSGTVLFANIHSAYNEMETGNSFWG